ncbi:Uncharacterised protein [Candidatus Bartonella washoeensis]|nr:Uncharacterised protein [Bartonella washoeensis]
MLMLGAILRVCNRIHSNLIDMGVMRFFQSIFVKQEWTIGMVIVTMLWGHLLDEEKKSTVESVTGIRRENMQAYDILAVPLDQYYTHSIRTITGLGSETRPINVAVVFAIKS